jgi:nicotinamide-nucleotide amidase
MKAEIISIGTELLLGEITDTNASYLASQLPLLGIDLLWVTQVGDNPGRMREALERAWGRSDLILTSGGLGPTEDDITREAIADTLGEELSVDPELERWLREFFSSRGYSMPASNIKQATLIPSAQTIPNPRGTAPGWWVERGEKLLIAMPGPPGEMQRMWEKEVSPRLHQGMGEQIIVSRTLKTFGRAEAAVGELVSPLLSSTNPSLGVYAKTDGIHLRITAKAERRQEAEEMIAEREAQIRSLLGDSIWGTDEETLEAVVGTLLGERGLTLATMESYTGGLLASTITSVPESSTCFQGGLVATSDEAKNSFGVDVALTAEYDAASPEVAGAMAEAARRRLGADIGLGVTGAISPVELGGRPLGNVHIAIDDGKNRRTARGTYPPQLPELKRRATYHALFELRKALISL